MLSPGANGKLKERQMVMQNPEWSPTGHALEILTNSYAFASRQWQEGCYVTSLFSKVLRVNGTVYTELL